MPRAIGRALRYRPNSPDFWRRGLAIPSRGSPRRPRRRDRRYPAPHQPHSLRHAATTNALDAGVPLRNARSWPATPTPAPPSTTTAPEETSIHTCPLPHPLLRRRVKPQSERAAPTARSLTCACPQDFPTTFSRLIARVQRTGHRAMPGMTPLFDRRALRQPIGPGASTALAVETQPS